MFVYGEDNIPLASITYTKFHRYLFKSIDSVCTKYMYFMQMTNLPINC